MVLVFLEQKLELLHKEAADNLVLAFLKDVQAVKADFLSHLANDVCIDAGHVDLNSGNFFNVLSDELKALAHESINLEKLSGYEDGHSILIVKLGPTILLDGRTSLFLAFLVTLLHFELPGRLHTVSDCFLKFVLIRLFLFILFHGEDVVEEPLKDGGVAVDGDVDLVIV